MNAVSLFAFGAWTLVLSHLVPLLGIVAVVLVIVVFGPVATLSFLRSRVGNVLVALVIAAILGWEARALLDQSIRLRDTLVAERKASAEALAREHASAVAQAAIAAEARRQAEAQSIIADAAVSRETAATADAAALQEQVDDDADQFAAEAKSAGARPCALSDADARSLRGLGRPRARSAR